MDGLPLPSAGISIDLEFPSNDLPILHRIARASKARGGSGQSGDDESVAFNFTNPAFTEFITYEWWHPRLLANCMFAMSTVVSFLRMLQYAVVSDVIGPFQISLGTMVAQTANFFVVVGIVMFSFAVGFTYLYEYYDLVKARTCGGDSGGECGGGKFSK